MPVYLTGTLTCETQAQADSVAAHLPDHLRLTRAEPGCLTFEVARTPDPRVWAVSESFRDRAAFDAHQTRTRESLWFAATAGIARDFTVTET